jgi:cell division protease FtsH
MEYGMSDKLGPMTLGHKQEQVFLGRDFVAEPNYSDEVAYEIDQEVRRLIEEAHQEAQRILTDQRNRLDVIARILIDRETVDKDELSELLEGDPDEVLAKFLAEKKKEEEEQAAKPVERVAKLKPRKVPKPEAPPKPEVQPE